MLIPHHTVILVVDGARMQILRNRGTPSDFSLETLADETQSNPPSRLLESDLAGRMRGGGAMASDSFQADDRHQQQEDDFVASALDRVEALANDDAPLVIIAPPKVLGRLRQRLSTHMAAHVLVELNKDLAHRPPHEIAMYLHNHRE